MAKRTPRSDATDMSAAVPAPARSRARTGKAAAEARPAPQGAPETAGFRDVESQSMASEPSEEDIRLRAYHLYLERGGRHGAHNDDWYQAERELKEQKK